MALIRCGLWRKNGGIFERKLTKCRVKHFLLFVHFKQNSHRKMQGKVTSSWGYGEKYQGWMRCLPSSTASLNYFGFCFRDYSGAEADQFFTASDDFALFELFEADSFEAEFFYFTVIKLVHSLCLTHPAWLNISGKRSSPFMTKALLF